ncbi:hypothetical protein HCH52_02480 [Oscillospiraceae bacterium HV4-5-C5C]|nr:hypothetical protein [Oscillospiraceae bacterium HV4-5-C5C]
MLRSKQSFERIDYRPRRSHALHRLAAFLGIAAGLMIALAVLTISAANRLTGADTAELSTPTSNIMPAYQNVSFASLDESFTLKGWLFFTEYSSRGTVIMVHDYGQNRLMYGKDSAAMYSALTDAGFNVLSFDLRHSGSSGGDMHGFGYSEWEDVLAATQQAYRLTGDDQFIYLAEGSGITAVLRAIDYMGSLGQDSSTQTTASLDTAAGQATAGSSFPSAETTSGSTLSEDDTDKLEFTKAMISGLILDQPLDNGDEYIKAALAAAEPDWISALTASTVPYAVRLSAGLAAPLYTVKELNHFLNPVLLITRVVATDQSTAAADTSIGDSSQVINERLRLLPSLTTEYSLTVPSDSSRIDYTEYINAVTDFLHINF